MYARYAVMRLYRRAVPVGRFIRRAAFAGAILYTLYMAISQIYVGIVYDAEERGAERKKIENFETWKKMNATKGRVPKP